MSRNRVASVIGLLAVAIALGGLSTSATATFGVYNQHSIVPVYFRPQPSDPSNAWYTDCKIMNPANGPGTVADSDYLTAVNYCRNRGQDVIGYVYTSYESRPIADAEADVDKYYAWYHLDGSFVDEMSNATATASYYRELYSYIHRKAGYDNNLVVGNPGASAPASWQLEPPASADTVVIFEGDASSFSTWTAPTWVAEKTADEIAVIVYNVPDANALQAACSHTRSAHAGFVYMTDSTGAPLWCPRG